MNKLREQFEKECGWYPSEVDDRMDWRYIDEYREWLEQRIKAGQHETLVIGDSWISTDDTLPEMGSKKYCSDTVLVAVICRNGVRYADTTEYDSSGYWYDFNPEYGYKITHWMPIPEPPKSQ